MIPLERREMLEKSEYQNNGFKAEGFKRSQKSGSKLYAPRQSFEVIRCFGRRSPSK